MDKGNEYLLFRRDLVRINPLPVQGFEPVTLPGMSFCPRFASLIHRWPLLIASIVGNKLRSLQSMARFPCANASYDGFIHSRGLFKKLCWRVTLQVVQKYSNRQR